MFFNRALSRLPFSVDTVDVGTKPRNVTVVGRQAQFGTIGGKQGILFNNNASNYVKVPNTGPHLNTFSVSYWVYSLDAGAYSVCSLANTANANDLTRIAFQNDVATGRISTQSAQPTQWAVTTSVALTYAGVWTHVVVAVNNNNPFSTTLYVNGAFVTTSSGAGPTSANFAFATDFLLGRSGNYLPVRSFNGYMRQWMLYDYPLGAAEVAMLYSTTA
jgi:hypothetical protein